MAKQMTIPEAIELATGRARVMCWQGKYRCEARTELARMLPRNAAGRMVIRMALETVRKEYDFPTKREMGLY